MNRPFHHGNLRAVLLQQAETMLREQGLDGLSLRELARQAGVSHGAPRSHFIDRQALLDALAEQGFDRFTDRVTTALAAPGPVRERFRSVGRAYVDFAVDNAALMELMFAAKSSGPVQDAALRFFGVLDGAMAGDDLDDDVRTRFKLLFAATMQGTATLITAQRVTREQGQRIVDDAADALCSSELGAQILSSLERAG